MTLRIDTRRNSRAMTVCTVSGRLDSETAPELEKVLDLIIENETTDLVFDLTGLDYISSAGLRTVFRAKRAMAQRDGTARVVGMSPPVAKVFEIVKAIPAESIFASWEELDRYLDRIQKNVRDGDA
jgi:anti-anti-sigma factor